jgi:hypothetical protein
LASITFEKVAVTPEQIEEWDLTTRSTKKSDSRAKSFKGESVAVDAIPPKKLRMLADDCISSHINENVLEQTGRIEEAERVVLQHLIELVGA